MPQIFSVVQFIRDIVSVEPAIYGYHNAPFISSKLITHHHVYKFIVVPVLFPIAVHCKAPFIDIEGRVP